MATLSHPASLNPLKQFAQAYHILRKTSRASNPAWYQEAHELPFQVHIRVDGPQITTFYFDQKKNLWSAGPTLTEETLNDPSKIAPFANEVLRYSRSQGATALGMILHVADEFATAELKPEFDSPAALNDLREKAYLEPSTILEDASIQADQSAWRVLPYPAAGSSSIATTIALSRHYAPFFEALRHLSEQANFPIITRALSAPLVAIMGLSHAIAPGSGRPFVAILQYPWLTALAFFNEHADLKLIRTLQHRGLRRPTNFRNTMATTNASLEFVDPDLFLIPLGSNVDTVLDADLRITFANSRVETLQFPLPEGVPAWCPEPVIAAITAATDVPHITSHTFSILRDDHWATQNFLQTPKELVEIYPTRSEMKLLQLARLSWMAMAACALLSLCYVAYSTFRLVSRPEWSFDTSTAQAAKGRISNFGQEKAKANSWGNLLEDRSKAWASLEALAIMFPKDGGMIVKSYTHGAKPENTAGKATVGFIKEWKISGLARDEALDYLNRLNTREGIAAHFNEVARVTGNSAYNPSATTRSLVINVRTQENTGYKPAPVEDSHLLDDSTYPFTFDLTITQRFEATDPLAINSAKIP